MKKTYIAPKVKALLLNYEGMIAGSIGSDLEGTGYGGNSSDTELPDGGDSHRRTTIWDNTEW